MTFLIWLLASCLCGILYRLGGIGKPFRTWMRDWIIPLVAYGYLLTLWHPVSLIGWLMLIPAIALTGGALTTYWDELFGYDNFWFHGFMIGLASFPFIWSGLHWWAVLTRAVLLAVLIGGWSAIFGNDWVEECGRGVFISATIPLLLI